MARFSNSTPEGRENFFFRITAITRCNSVPGHCKQYSAGTLRAIQCRDTASNTVLGHYVQLIHIASNAVPGHCEQYSAGTLRAIQCRDTPCNTHCEQYSAGTL